MKTKIALLVGLMTGAALGATSIGALNAQNKGPGAYAVVEFSDFGDPAAFKSNVGEPSPAVVKKHGGRFLARTDTVTTLRSADSPITRYVIIAFDDVKQAQTWWNSDDWKPIRTYLDQKTKGRSFVVEALPQ
ncbi:MAG: DUF1330 domain-containing protein [Reyranellaceae bacterium]